MHRLLTAIVFIVTIISATETKTQKTAIFIECRFCNEDFIKEQIPYVDYVRDRLDAEIHIMETSQRTGSGGDEYSLYFIGQFKFKGKNDTLSFTSSVDDTDDQIRKERVRVIQIGLVPYLLKTPLASLISVDVASVLSSPEKVEDKWNNWVFKIRGNSYMNAQQLSRSINIFGNISASRVTEDWKINFSTHGSYNENMVEYDGVEYLSTADSRRFSGSAIMSLTDHMSAGLWTSAWNSSYGNTDMGLAITPKFEYNLYPYSESNQQSLRLQYSLSAKQVGYTDTTIYFKTKENLFSEGASVSYNTVKPWGSINTSISGNHYFHDFSKNIVSLNTGLSLRLIKGLSLNLNGSGSMVHNQLSIPKGNYSIEDVLLERAELETQFTSFASIGFSYSFGSIYNSIVNLRFSGGGRGYSVFF
jgi:hypothetical protein